MKFVVTCPQCGVDHDMPEDTVGKKLRCKKCGDVFRVQHGVSQATSRDENQPCYTFTVLPETSKPIGHFVDRPNWPRYQAPTPKEPRSVAPSQSKKVEPFFPGSSLDDGERILAIMGACFLIVGGLAILFPLMAMGDPSLRAASRIVPIIGMCCAVSGSLFLAGGFRRYPGWAAGFGGIGSVVSIFVFFLIISPLLAKTPRPHDSIAQESGNQATATDQDAAAESDASQDRQKPATRHPYQARQASTNDFIVPRDQLPDKNSEEVKTPASPADRETGLGDGGNTDAASGPPDTQVPPENNPPVDPLVDIPPNTPGVGNRTKPAPEKEDNPFVELPKAQIRDSEGVVHADLRSEDEKEASLKQLFERHGWHAASPKINYYGNTDASSNRKLQLLLQAQSLAAAVRNEYGVRVNSVLPSAHLTPVAGREGSTRLTLFHPEKVPVVGVRYDTQNWRGSQRIAILNPVFDRNSADVDALAKDGYAIAGMEVNASACVDGFRLIYMRLNGDQFDTNDRYESSWYGIPGEDDQIKRLGASGRPIYGFYLRHSQVLDGVALITDP